MTAGMGAWNGGLIGPNWHRASTTERKFSYMPAMVSIMVGIFFGLAAMTESAEHSARNHRST